MMILIQRICIAFNGFGRWNTVARAMRDSAAMLLQTRTYVSKQSYEETSQFFHVYIPKYYSSKELGDERAELEADEIAYVVVDSLSLFDGGANGEEVVVEENHICRLLAHIRPTPT